MRVEKDVWLSDVFGISSWKVTDLAAVDSPSDIRADVLNQDGFFSAKIPASDVATVANAVRAGFLVVDVNVTLDWNGDLSDISKIDAGHRSALTVGGADADDLAAVEAIAGGCFAYSRFHLDPAIGRESANELKRQWVRNAFRGRASAIYVARQQGDVAGFLVVLVNGTPGKVDAIIDLVGVKSDYQGRGAGRALSKMFIEQWCRRAKRLRVGTQVSNIPALRLYESIGFRIVQAAYVLHAHVRNGALAA